MITIIVIALLSFIALDLVMVLGFTSWIAYRLSPLLLTILGLCLIGHYNLVGLAIIGAGIFVGNKIHGGEKASH